MNHTRRLKNLVQINVKFFSTLTKFFNRTAEAEVIV